MNPQLVSRESTPLGLTLALLICSLVLGATAQDAPKLINYQGRLTDAAGQSLSNGIYRVRFEIFAAKDATQPGGTNVIWGATYTNVVVVSGQFNVVLGAAGGGSVAGAAVNELSFAFGQSERYLQMTVESGPGILSAQTLSPRQQFLWVPYAINGVPAGSVMPYAGTNIPSGWLVCDGSSHSATNPLHVALFAAIGKTYGAGDGSPLSFQLPDLRGRVVVGVGQGDGLSTRLLSQQFGRESHSEVPQHSHPVEITTSSNGSHSHNVLRRIDGNSGNENAAENGTGDSAGNMSTSSAGSHSHSVSGATGSNLSGVPSVNIMPPSTVLNYIIKL